MIFFRQLVPGLLVSSSFAISEAQLGRPENRHWVNAASNPEAAWKMRETRLVSDFSLEPVPAEALNRFGGLRKGSIEGTGNFRVEKLGERWWMIDPEGGLFVFNGVCSVKPEDRFAAEEPFARLFGSKDVWAEKTLGSLREMGFKGVGGFSDHGTLRAAGSPVPYTVALGLMSHFGRRLGLTHEKAGHTGYEEDCLPVFHPDFPSHCFEACQKQLSEMKEDPWLVGVFSDNELPVARDMLDRMLELDDKRAELVSMRAEAESFVAGKGPITDELRQDFVEHVYETYFRITTTAIREVLPNHLCLGSRFHGPAKNQSAVWRAAGRWCDAISMNYYDHWSPESGHLAQWHEWSGKPCLITEFYVKATDSGMPNSSGAGWLVKTQADRGAFYQNFTLALLESKTCIGWHWFKYMDNDPLNTTTDASNKDSNKGIFNARFEPYMPLIEPMRELNERVFPLMELFDRQ